MVDRYVRIVSKILRYIRSVQAGYLTAQIFFSLIIATAYNGNLVAFMTEPGMQEPFDTPEKVLDEKIDIGMYNYQGSTTIAFSGTKNPLYKQIWQGTQGVLNAFPLAGGQIKYS